MDEMPKVRSQAIPTVAYVEGEPTAGTKESGPGVVMNRWVGEVLLVELIGS
jgi:hypothetical protein